MTHPLVPLRQVFGREREAFALPDSALLFIGTRSCHGAAAAVDTFAGEQYEAPRSRNG
jgi:hypothetical protein